MTTPSLFDLPPSSVPEPVYKPRTRTQTEPTRTQMVIDYFKAHPNEWIDGLTFAEFAGAYAWRSRISEARASGMNIENRQRTEKEHAANCPALQAWDIEGACSGCKKRTFVHSEYRYVPA